MKIRAAVCRASKAPLILEELELDDPREHEVLVRVTSCGICHTDVAMRDQVYPITYPMVLGHEGAGIVQKVGACVEGFTPGDPVLMSFDSCGHCPACHDALPGFCDNFFPLNFVGSRLDGSTTLHKGDESIRSNFFGQSTFATHALTHPRNLLKLDSSDHMDYFGPLGCGVQTGAGAVLNALCVRPGDSFAVFGIGAVALSAVMAAHATGATTIVAVGRNDAKLRLAKKLGATHVVNSSHEADVVAAIRAATGRGVSHALDTTGQPTIIQQAVAALDSRGVCAVLGSSPMGTQMQLDVPDLMMHGKRIIGTVEGNSVPQVFIPKLIDLHRQGRFPLEKIVKFYPFEKINEAITDSEQGRVIKAVVRMSYPRISTRTDETTGGRIFTVTRRVLPV